MKGASFRRYSERLKVVWLEVGLLPGPAAYHVGSKFSLSLEIKVNSFFRQKNKQTNKLTIGTYLGIIVSA